MGSKKWARPAVLATMISTRGDLRGGIGTEVGREHGVCMKRWLGGRVSRVWMVTPGCSI